MIAGELLRSYNNASREGAFNTTPGSNHNYPFLTKGPIMAVLKSTISEDFEQETWKDTPDFLHYQVSSQGRVRSQYARGHSKPTNKWRLLKPGKNSYGYWRIGLKSKNISIFRFIHVLMLEAFVGPRPGPVGKFDGRHLDDNRDNNTLRNLAWGTRSDNLADSKRNGRECNGSKSPNAKLTEMQVIIIRRRLIAGESQISLANEFKVDHSHISDIHRRKKWRHI